MDNGGGARYASLCATRHMLMIMVMANKRTGNLCSHGCPILPFSFYFLNAFFFFKTCMNGSWLIPSLLFHWRKAITIN